MGRRRDREEEGKEVWVSFGRQAFRNGDKGETSPARRTRSSRGRPAEAGWRRGRGRE